MGNYKLVFYGTEESKSNDHELTAYMNHSNELYVNIEGYTSEFIVLDIDTAVRFSRELRRVIAEMKEVDNG
tara:strand:+ start:186 stop:398 length:213 start_codon:yes stop_codon:yes gene_type:complete